MCRPGKEGKNDTLMASEIAPTPSERYPETNVFLRTYLPLFLLLLLVVLLGGGVYYGLMYVLGASQVTDTLETEFVLRRLELPIHIPQGTAFHLSRAGL